MPPEGFFEAVVQLPLSKSVSARQLVIDAIGGVPTRTEVAKCDDTDALRAGLELTSGTADARLAGTALRFLTAYYAATPGVDITLTGDERLRERPIGVLAEALRELGADIEYVEREGFAPLHIRGRRLRGGSLKVSAETSSQFISALMMIAPTMEQPLTLTLEGQAVSTSYISMTAVMMRQRGIDVEFDTRAGIIEIGAGSYNADVRAVEIDWSAASYWYMLTALTAGRTILPGAVLPSLQGDSNVAEIFERLGVATAPYEPEDDDDPAVECDAMELSASPEIFSTLEADLCDTPDLAPTYAVTAAMIGIPFRLSGLRTLRVKETDRISALQTELAKTGVITEAEGDDALSWDGRRRPITEMPVFDTYNDHRMAMALAGVSVYIPGIVIRDAEVVTKSYPAFWEHLEAAGFQLADPKEPLEK